MVNNLVVKLAHLGGADCILSRGMSKPLKLYTWFIPKVYCYIQLYYGTNAYKILAHDPSPIAKCISF